ncbi:MAG TPA: pyridoxamine 5'-phosphate oxidase family protein [Acidimicrobiales bacterium]|nr:pyridoxamine 5'-phosphate oxidase family protein [Acidimicrobiales bacterium]
MSGLLTWNEVGQLLKASPIYWLHTTNRSGAPDASPVWGVIVDERLYIYSMRSTLKARNVERDSRVLVHLESGADVIIVHGVLSDLGHPQDFPEIVDAFGAKYDHPAERPFLPSSDPAFDVLYVLRPQRALRWNLPDSEASMRRWSAEA